MKIGILTYHCPPNFGAQLQTLSTTGYLLKNGHSPIVLNWYAKDLEEMYSKRIPKDQSLCHERFSNDAFPLSNKCQNIDTLIIEINRLNLDAIIVGSDALFKFIPIKLYRRFSFRHLKYYQLFNPLSCEQLNANPFWGAFLEKLNPRIPASVYAVSSQNCPYQQMANYEKKQMASALANYREISVRDSWTQQMIKDVTHRKIVPVYPDPVFAFNQNCNSTIPSKKEIYKKYNIKKNYILFSFGEWHCDPQYISDIAKEAELSGFQPIALPMPEKLVSASIKDKIDLPLSPIEWYALIIYSSGYVGERMHPIIVCLHNSIPFFSFDEYGTKEKTSTLTIKKVLNPLSSKTFSVVSAADLTEHLHSYQQGNPLPSPKHVICSLLSFDKDKCRAFAKKQYEEYVNGMSSIINSLM